MHIYAGTENNKEWRVEKTMPLSFTHGDHCRKFNYDFVLAGKFVYCHYLSMNMVLRRSKQKTCTHVHILAHCMHNSIQFVERERERESPARSEQRKERKEMKLTN